MNLLKHHREQRGRKEDELDAIIKKCETEKRTRDSEERTRWETLKKEIDELTDEIRVLEEREKADMRSAKPIARRDEDGNEIHSGIESESEKRYLDFQIKEKAVSKRHMPATDYVLKNFDVNERMQKVDVYSVIAGMMGKKYPEGSATNYAIETEKRSLTSSALLNPFLSAQLLDGGLSKSRVVEAGAKVFTMVEGTHKFARIATYPTLEWKAALASTTERTIAFDSVDFAAKTLRGWITVSGETLRDAMNIEQALKRVFSKALANGLDTSILTGAGGDAPTGIENYANVNEVVWNDTLDDYDAWVAAQQAIYEQDGGDINATIMSPDAWSQLARMKGTAEFQPVNPPFFLRNHRFMETSKLSDPGQNTSIFTGVWDSLNIGVRLQAEIILTPVTASTYGYDMLAVFRGDVKPDREEDFAVITEVHPAPSLT